MPATRRIMFFIDGENIVCRYQAMLGKGFVPKIEVCHEQDVYAWQQGLVVRMDVEEIEIIRAYYYTSVVGDDVKVRSVVDDLKKLQARAEGRLFRRSSQIVYHHLYPVVFKKAKQSNKTKVVDIQLAVDVLTHVYQNNLDTVCLFSGDGDYKAVINEVIRRGKQIYIAAFSDGLNLELKQLADKIIDLDHAFFDLDKSPKPST